MVCGDNGHYSLDSPTLQLYLFDTIMPFSSEKQTLPNLLRKLTRKRAALLLQKLTLFHNDNEQDVQVRHYDA